MSKTCQGTGWASSNTILAKEKYSLKQKKNHTSLSKDI